MARRSIDLALLAAAFTGFKTLYDGGFKRAPVWWNKVAMRLPSDTESETYGWLDAVPAVRKWQGERKVRGLSTNGYRLTNEDWELTISVDRNHLMDDKVGYYAQRFQRFGRSAAKWPDQQIAALMKNGKTNKCLDGKAFFATDHPVDHLKPAGASYSNLNTSTALTRDNFNLVYATMQGYTDVDGQVMGIVPNKLFVPPMLRDEGLAIVKAGVVAVTQGSGAAAVTNVNMDLVEVVVVPELAGEDTTWYLAAVDEGDAPFIFQDRYDSGFVSRIEPTSDNVFNRKTYEYGQDWRAAFGYGMPFQCTRNEA